MPYLDPDEKREADRDRYVAKYQSSPKFAKKEKARQKEVYEVNKDKAKARVVARRERFKAMGLTARGTIPIKPGAKPPTKAGKEFVQVQARRAATRAAKEAAAAKTTKKPKK